MPDSICHISFKVGRCEPLQIINRHLLHLHSFVFSKGHPSVKDRFARYIDHVVGSSITKLLYNLSVNSFKQGFYNECISESIVSFGRNIKI